MRNLSSTPVSSGPARPRHAVLVALSIAAASISMPLTAQSAASVHTFHVDQTPVFQAPASQAPDLYSAPFEPSLLEMHPAELDLTPAARAEDGRGFTLTASADETSSSSLPIFGPQQSGNPPQQPSAASANAPDKPSKRIFGIIPNYRAVAIGAKLPPQSVKEKFVTATQDTFDPGAFALAFLVAGYNDARNNTPEFKSGGSGGVTYGRYLWHTFVDQSTENYAVEFIVPVLTHEDTRFYTLGSGGFTKRTAYALTRIFVTRSDSGHRTVNLSELGGAAISSAASNLYYPRAERTVGNSVTQYGTDLGIDAVSYFIREFDSDISNKLMRRHHKSSN